MPKKSNPSTPIYQLKVTLRGSKPPIWRRVQVRSDLTLYKLHQVLQLAMGWTNSHLHQFIAEGVYSGERDHDFDMDIVSERRTRLNQIVQEPKDRFIYEYDFGDGWEHDVVLEEVRAPEPRVRYPRCIKGRRNGPPEDVGGIGGYADFLEAIRNEDHPEHEEYLAWIGGEFDPEAFDLAETNEALEQIR